jgi:AcrR family transcriptional regulator
VDVQPVARSGVAPSRKAITQQKILRASMELFSSRGYHRASTSQIAARAGVSRASIFWHFSDKATLFDETWRYFLVPFREALALGRRSGDPRERVLRQLDAYETFIREKRATIRAFVGWIFASQPHAATLRAELLALHREFQSGLARDLAELLPDPAQAPGLAAMAVAVLHGEMLITLGRELPSAAPARAMLDRVLRERCEATARR